MIMSETFSRIKLNSSKINKLLKTITDEIAEISSVLNNLTQKNNENRIAELRTENDKLEKEIENYKQELRLLRSRSGITQIPIPSFPDVTQPTPEPKQEIDASKNVKSKNLADVKVQSKEKRPIADKEEEIHFGRLDIKVGKIVNVEKHPNADSLYIEQVDVGEGKPRTIISGLVKYVPIEQLKDRIALFLCNLKPVKMRGISSEGMIMCTSSDEQCEILEPPSGSFPGEVVTVPGFERKPDCQLNPKKKIFETVQVDLKVNERKEATYKGIPWNVGGRGPAMSKTLMNTIIK